ncbi:MAG TPA: RluA family pseudouridine synthase [Flavobacteriales bacterium]|nr:RluA family pseudouridine synthase [Flavobacteriales bacterium]
MHAEDDKVEENDELYEHLKISVEKGVVMRRIDKFLFDRIPQTSRNRIQVAARAGNILVNQKPVKSNYKVKPFDEISLVLPYPVREYELKGENIPLDILFEDDDVIVLNKPAGMVSHPGHGNYTGTLVNALVYHFDNLPLNKSNEISRPGLVHRLDKFTTGIMVIAKTEHALTHLSKQFYDRTSERTYYALVWGNPKNTSGTVTGHIGRSVKDRKVFMVYEDGSQGKHAVTHYEVIKNYAHVSLVKCKLETGRTHQIRVHMKYIGHTLFNDKEYGGDVILRGNTSGSYKKFVENCFELIPGQALHAKTLGFMHPTKNEFMQFDSELPPGFQALLEKWEKFNT